MSHVSWTSIESFYAVRKMLVTYPQLCGNSSVVTYKAKVKLHGTNAGIRIDADGTITALSREVVITPEADNCGFAKWVEARKEDIKELVPEKDTIVIYGEWCGPGIMKGTAVNQLQEKIFAIFAAVTVAGTDANLLPLRTSYVYEPSELEKFADAMEGSYVVPWFNNGEEFKVDWSQDAEALQPVIDNINKYVAQVEKTDPWMMSQFAINGIGEGLVFYPISHPGYKSFSDLCFKAKGEKHKTVAHTKPAQADPTVVANAEAFADLVVTEARMEQGVRAVNNGELVFDVLNMSAFMKWMNEDLVKETSAELEASGLDAKVAYKMCSNKARNWFVGNTKKL